ncbi:MAG: YitT family protein, partial [Chloroflexota bacterium]
GFSDDRLLNSLFGGILGGVGGGIVFRTGTNFGGTSVLALILQRKFGLPLSQTFLYVDTFIVAASGLVFGIEGALYAMIVVFVGGVASDYVMEGPSVIRTAFVMTNYPREVSDAVMEHLHRGVTSLPARGMYSGSDRAMLYITVSRAQVNELRHIVADVDENAFLVIGQGHTAYGVGFKPIKKTRRKPEPAPVLTITVPAVDVPPEDTPLPEAPSVEAVYTNGTTVTVPAVNTAPEDTSPPT